MILKNCDYQEFLKDIENKRITCFGTGKMLEEMENDFLGTFFVNQRIQLTDNDSKKWGMTKKVFGRETKIKPPSEILSNMQSEDVLIITNSYYMDILKQLKEQSANNFHCYIFHFIRSLEEDRKSLAALKDEQKRKSSQLIIPKKIHYTWFSGEKLPSKFERYKDTWKRFCPDYEIIEWNQENYDFSESKYARQAIEHKKWGFAGDYVRLDVIHKYGGIYLDLDVEVVKNLDELLKNKAYAGFESINYVNLGSGFGAIKGFPLIEEMKKEYEDIDFYDKTGELNLTPSPIYQTRTLKKHGLNCNGNIQEIKEMKIYPFEYLCAQSVNTGIIYKTSNTYSIHRFAASWKDTQLVEDREKKLELLRKLSGY